jgi:predicted nucleotide-binding protein
MNKAEAIARIKKQISKISDLEHLRRGSPDFKKWRRDTKVALAYIFGDNSRHVSEFSAIRFTLMAWGDFTTEREYERAYRSGLDSSRAVLKSMIEEIRDYWKEDSQLPMPAIASQSLEQTEMLGKEIFIIHGHDDGLKQTVARFLEKIELNPVILHEQPNKGRTIIEKFEQYATVDFAVALFTADDLCSSGQGADAAPTYRARQNVVFEFGFFIGKLGRERVCALYEEGVELPSDYQGVLYIPLDKSGNWRFALLKELKSIGYDVDANRALI